MGYGVILSHGRKIEYVASGVLNFEKEDNFFLKIGLIFESTRDIITKFQPDEISIESLIYVKSVTSLSKLAQARGAAIAGIISADKKRIVEYSPNLIKSAVTGHGHSSKEEIQKTLGMILKVNSFKTHDESDALAIAICHHFCKNSRAISGQSSKIGFA